MITFGILLTTISATGSHHLDPIANCVLSSFVQHEYCRIRIIDWIGRDDEPVTKCCYKWYMNDCLSQQFELNCKPEHIQAYRFYKNMTSFLRASSECIEYPSTWYCDRHYLFRDLIFWSAITLPTILVIAIMIAAFYYFGYIICCRKQKQKRRAPTASKEDV